MRPVEITGEQLEHLYCKEGKSQSEIASLFQCDQVTIQGWMKRLKIPTRSRSEAAKLGIKRNPGRHYRFPSGYKPLPRISVNVDLAKTLYLDMRFGVPEIARILSLNKELVRHRLARAGIVFRKRGEALRGRKRPDMVKRMRDPEFQKRITLALQRRPNKPEKYLDGLLQKHFPNQWGYVGDGKVIIHGLSPDFINCNGHKAIIEVFGDYWHRSRGNILIYQTEYGRKAIFAKYGYKTLILWESELAQLPESEIVTKIEELTQVIE